jgi:hypothetical protein
MNGRNMNPEYEFWKHLWHSELHFPRQPNRVTTATPPRFPDGLQCSAPWQRRLNSPQVDSMANHGERACALLGAVED